MLRPGSRLSSSASTQGSGLDRLATRAGTTLSYAGAERALVADGISTFARNAAGGPVALGKGATNLALNDDARGDVTGAFVPAASGLADARAYDPWGQVTAASGTTNPALGYQGAWTDPSTAKVSMDARFYEPATGAFASRDSVDDPAMANRYGYTPGNPLGYTDPTGHLANPLKAAANAGKAVVDLAKGVDLLKAPVRVLGPAAPVVGGSTTPAWAWALGLVGAAAVGAGIGTLSQRVVWGPLMNWGFDRLQDYDQWRMEREHQRLRPGPTVIGPAPACRSLNACLPRPGPDRATHTTTTAKGGRGGTGSKSGPPPPSPIPVVPPAPTGQLQLFADQLLVLLTEAVALAEATATVVADIASLTTTHADSPDLSTSAVAAIKRITTGAPHNPSDLLRLSGPGTHRSPTVNTTPPPDQGEPDHQPQPEPEPATDGAGAGSRQGDSLCAPRMSGMSLPVHSAGSLTNAEARAFYLEGEVGIAMLNESMIAHGIHARVRALELIRTRNALRTQARSLMADRQAAELLNLTEPNRTLAQLVGNACRNKGLVGDDLWEYLADSASRSRTSVNEAFGL